MIKLPCLVSLVMLLPVCNQKPARLPSMSGPSQMPRVESMPSLIFLPEFQPFVSDYLMTAPTLDTTTLQAFAAVWQREGAGICRHITVDTLASLSRRAAAEVTALQLPERWWEKIPLRPVGVSADRRLILFGQFKEEGLPLPSHHPLVFRRLTLFAGYDPHRQRLATVIVSIGGWVEE
ncbi:MAG: hypothetical protein ONB51_03930 [candidate division KSB1 bacterium]|nr:hypothetical protein [candidate division KSB1 bacterium]MDZ7408370.1 hypothetical protein [candidate division KSB1 bacterium]